MRTGASGTFVIAWTQCELDGAIRAPLSALAVGAGWRWTGEAVRVDGPSDILVLDGAKNVVELRASAARRVRNLVSGALNEMGVSPPIYRDPDTSARLFDGAFDVTDGQNLYTLTIIDLPGLPTPLLMVLGERPPVDSDLWVVSVSRNALIRNSNHLAHGVICFTQGTRIATPCGTRLVNDLIEGDMVLTKDNGPQPLRWIGQRRFSGARLYAMPELRPIRFRANALGLGEPDEELVVSPEHRMLIKGRAARDLFAQDEVLVQARDLVNGQEIAFDNRLREVTYVHLMLDRHQILFANGVQSESFHPETAQLDQLSPQDRARLLAQFPDLAARPDLYGQSARRALSRPEAAILRHRAS